MLKRLNIASVVAGVLVGGALTLIGGLALNVFWWAPDLYPARWANVVGLGSVLILLSLCAPGFPQLIVGEDGRLSTSKFQALLWTIPLLYGLGAAGFMIAVGVASPAATVPKWLLLAATAGTLTALGAKGITTFKIDQSKQLQAELALQTSLIPRKWKLVDLWSDDTGRPQLTKAQLLLFTLLAVVTYMGQLAARVGEHVLGGKIELPDLDPTFMALAGIGQVAYLGRKTFDADTPLLGSVEPNPVNVPPQGSVTVALKGANLGTQASQVTLAGIPPGITYVIGVERPDEELSVKLER